MFPNVIIAFAMLAATAYVAWDYWRISQIYLPQQSRSAAYRQDTLEKIKGSWVFRDHVRFAELVTTPLTRGNAEHIYQLSVDLLHFSPEARVIEKLIESARITGREAEAALHEARFEAAFPQAFAEWKSGRTSTP